MKTFSVEELAQLCSVNKETVRRWRKLGVGGNFLKSDHEERTQGKPARFSAEDVAKFAAAVPRVMTPELKDALGAVAVKDRGLSGAVRVKVRRSGMDSRSAVFAAAMSGAKKPERTLEACVGTKISGAEELNIVTAARGAGALPIRAELQPDAQLKLGLRSGLRADAKSFAKKPGRLK